MRKILQNKHKLLYQPKASKGQPKSFNRQFVSTFDKKESCEESLKLQNLKNYYKYIKK